MKVYHCAQTRSVRVLWLLEELGVPYELVQFDFTPENLKKPEFLRISPLGKVPVIQDGELTMFESGAIVEYILEKYGNGRLAPAPGTPARGRFLQWIHFAEATASPPFSEMAQHTMVKPEAERIPAVVADAHGRAVAMAGVVEHALAGTQYLLGAEFSAADIMMGYTVLLMKWFGVLSDAYPNTLAYIARLEARPALQKALS